MTSDQDLQRRLAAVLCADVSGYTRLMELDETATHVAYSAYKDDIIAPSIASHGGRLVKSTGDGFIACFESVVDCLVCAREIQSQISVDVKFIKGLPMLFRMGINIGDVIDEADDIYGEGVNLAARIQEFADPGGICVSEGVYGTARHRVPIQFRSLGRKNLKNIAATRIYHLAGDGSRHGVVAGWFAQPIGRFAKLLMLVVLLLGALGGVWIAWPGAEKYAAKLGLVGEKHSEDANPGTPSIAVLPFDNLTGNSEQEYFSEGLAGDIIARLSRIKGLLVVARRSSFAYKNITAGARQIGRDLRVRFVLEGSLRRQDDLIRINASLIDAMTGHNVWVRQYDATGVKIVTLHDRVAQDVASALSIKFKLAGLQSAPAQETTNVAAYDAFLHGWSFYQRKTLEDNRRAIAYLNTAVRLDPGYSYAHAALGNAYLEARLNSWPIYSKSGSNVPGGPSDQDHGEVLSKLRRNLETAEYHLDKSRSRPTALTYRLASRIALIKDEHQVALGQARRAIDLDPNDPESLAQLARVYIWAGLPDKAIEETTKATRLDPKFKTSYTAVLGAAAFCKGDYAKAAELLTQSTALNPDPVWPAVHLIAALAYLKRYGEAQAKLAELNDRLQRMGRGNYSTFEARRHIPYQYESDQWRLTLGLSLATSQ